jgi:hypothetical protein
LLRLLAGLDTPDGVDLEAPAERMVAFQEHRLLPWRRVRQNVALVLPRNGARDAAAKVFGDLESFPVDRDPSLREYHERSPPESTVEVRSAGRRSPARTVATPRATRGRQHSPAATAHGEPTAGRRG